MKFFLFGLVALILPHVVSASACCSGGGSLPSVILNDDRWSVRSSIANSYTVAESRNDGKTVWRDSAMEEQLTSITNSFVYRFGDQWQSGIRLPVKQRRISDQSSWGLGDFNWNIAYEAFPLYTYSSWRPKIFFFVGMSFPIGMATYESSQPQLESQGTGFFSPSSGFILSRAFSRWDYFSFFEAKYQFARKFEFDKVDPGWIFTGKLGAGYSLSSLRLGLALGPTYEQEKMFESSGSQQGEKLVWDSEIDLSYTWTDSWSSHIAYADQTWIGPAKNVSLQRSLSLGFVYHGI